MDWPPWVALVHSLRGDGGTEEGHEVPIIQLQAMRLLCFSLVHSSYWSHLRVVDMSDEAAMDCGASAVTPGSRIRIVDKRHHRLLHGTPAAAPPPTGMSNSSVVMDPLCPVTPAAYNHNIMHHVTSRGVNSSSSRQVDVLTVRYGVLLHKLRSYYELDVTRLSAFHRVASLVGRLDLEEVGVRLSMPPIKWGRMRLIDNLWSHIGLLDSTAHRLHLNSKVTSISSSTGSSDTAGPIIISGGGADMLQREARAVKTRFEQHSLGAQHEARFLQWLSSSLPSQGSSSSSVSKDKDDAAGGGVPPPPRLRDSSNTTARTMHDSGSTDDASDDLLDRAVGGSASAMGALEEAVLDLVDAHAFSLLEMEELSRMIDRELLTDGLTEETIDQLFLDDNNSSSSCCGDDDGDGDDACTADGKGDEDNVRACHLEAESSSSSSILLAHHCEYSSGTDYSSTSMMMIQYRRYLQQTLLSTDMSSADDDDDEQQQQQRHGHSKQLLHLRSLHKQTLRRTSAACAKYNPFDIVWKDLG